MGEPAPLVGVPEAPVPAGAAAEWFAGAGGARLRAAYLPASAAPRGSVIVSGGRTETIEKYFEVADELRARGFAVLAHDWRGQGLSARLLPDPAKGHAEHWGDFVADYEALLSAFEARLPRPWIALSHSMGACLTLLALAGGERRIAAAALTAPMLGVRTGAPPFVARSLAAAITALGAGGAFTPGGDTAAAPFDRNMLTRDRPRYVRAQAQMAACPALRLAGPTWGWLNFAFEAMDAAIKAAPAVRIPLLVVGAGDERLVDEAAVRRLAERAPAARLVEIPGAMHEILQETDAARALFWKAFDALAAEVAPTSPTA
ncbi:MAG: alpha/beta hydrolase [Caulobacteraceae bacterium]|nr:alpha/beta hydrolase [Caulobacteraceae bacterium]